MRFAIAPAQIVGLLTATTGKGVTVTIATAVPEHPEVVPVTVYDTVDAGLAAAAPTPVEVAPADQV